MPIKTPTSSSHPLPVRNLLQANPGNQTSFKITLIGPVALGAAMVPILLVTQVNRQCTRQPGQPEKGHHPSDGERGWVLTLLTNCLPAAKSSTLKMTGLCFSKVLKS